MNSAIPLISLGVVLARTVTAHSGWEHVGELTDRFNEALPAVHPTPISDPVFPRRELLARPSEPLNVQSLAELLSLPRNAQRTHSALPPLESAPTSRAEASTSEPRERRKSKARPLAAEGVDDSPALGEGKGKRQKILHQGVDMKRSEAMQRYQGAIPDDLRREHDELSALRSEGQKNDWDAHARFWTKIVARRDPNFSAEQHKDAAEYIKHELLWWSKTNKDGTRAPNRIVSTPFHLHENISQLAARQRPDTKYVGCKGGESFKFRSWSVQARDGKEAPAVPKGASKAEIEGYTERHLKAAMERSRQRQPPAHFTPEEVGLARNYIKDELIKVNWRYKADLAKGRDVSCPNWFSGRRCSERETISELANRWVKLKSKNPIEAGRIEKAKKMGREKYAGGLQADVGSSRDASSSLSGLHGSQ